MRKLRSTFTYGNVTATLAVFLATSGAAVAVTAAPTNSVTSASIKNGQVKKRDVGTGAVSNRKIAANAVDSRKVANGSLFGLDIRDNSLTGADLDESSLGQVPRAARADRTRSADNAANANALGGVSPSSYARASLEPVRLLGTPGNPGFAPGWTNVSGSQPAGFYKDPFGIVHLTGTLNPPNSASTIFTLPEGYRPAPLHTLFGVNGDGAMTGLEVRQTGQVEVLAARSSYVALDGVRFRAGQ